MPHLMYRLQPRANFVGANPRRRDHADDGGVGLGADAPDVEVGDGSVAGAFDQFG